MKKIVKRILLVAGVIGLFIFIFFFIGKAPQPESIKWGVSFSQKQAEMLGLDWRETYLAILDEMDLEYLKITAYWDLVEPEIDKYYFDDLDFQIEEAEKRNIKLILAIGRKVPRWPECHLPEWVKSSNIQEERLLKYLEEIVLRYKAPCEKYKRKWWKFWAR